jgi:membrane protease YdiL (CAAX protease family)
VPEARYTRGNVSLAEPVVVLGAALVAGSAPEVYRLATDAGPAFTDGRIAASLLLQALLALPLLAWLRRRGWTPAAVAGAPAPRDAARGLGVWLGAMACIYLVFSVVALVDRDVALVLSDLEFTGTLSPWIIVVGSVGNALFEEFLWIGYTVPTLEGRLGLRGACAVSVLLRASLNLYQEPLTIVTVLPVGLFLTWYFAHTRRMWPVVVAHVMLDAIGLAQFVARAG